MRGEGDAVLDHLPARQRPDQSMLGADLAELVEAEKLGATRAAIRQSFVAGDTPESDAENIARPLARAQEIDVAVRRDRDEPAGKT